MGAKDDGFRRFSNMQWYLAQAQNRVHLACACPEDIAPEVFRDLVARVLAQAPQLGWAEDLAADGLRDFAPVAVDTLAHYFRASRQGWCLRDFDALLAEPLAPGAPAFRARCMAATEPDARGLRAWVLFEASHALTEGGDIGAILRGRGAGHDRRPIFDVPRRGWRRLALAVSLPALWALHLGASFTERRKAAHCRVLRVSLDLGSVALAARRLGVTQRALLFGLVIGGLFGGEARRRALNIGYSSLPKARARLLDDTFLNVRMDEFRVKPTGTPETDVRAAAEAIARRGPMPLSVQAWHNALLGVHRRVQQLVPGLYRHGFFDYSPYDLVLSLVPQVRPGKAWGPLDGVTCFAGSNTGATPNCIYAVGARQITLSLWLPPALAARQGVLLQAAAMLGISAETWE